MADPRQDEVALLAWGVLVAAQQDGITDPNLIAHAIASNVLRRIRAIERATPTPSPALAVRAGTDDEESDDVL